MLDSIALVLYSSPLSDQEVHCNTEVWSGTLTQAELNILIRVQAQQAQAQLAAMRTQLAAMDAQLKRTQASSNGNWFAELSKSGSRLQWIGRQLTTNLSLPLGLAAGMAVKWGIENETAMARVGKLYGDTDELAAALIERQKQLGQTLPFDEAKTQAAAQYKNELEALDKVASTLSETFGVNKKVVLDIAGDWAAAGSSGLALAKSVGLTLRTMVIGEMDATEATRALIAIQAQFGASIDGVGVGVDGAADKTGGLVRIINQLNAVENVTGTKLNDLVVAYSRAAGVASQAGVSTGELAAMVAALTPAAGTASEAGTALKTMISRLLTPTEEARDVMKAMGIEVDKTSWQSLTATERLELMATKFDTLTQGQKEAASSLIASRYHINKFAVLLKALQNPLGYYAKAMNVVNDEVKIQAIAQKELETVLGTSSQKAKTAGQIIKNNLTDAFTPLIPIFIWIAQAVAKMFQNFTTLHPAIQKIAIVAVLVAAALGPFIIMLGLMKLAIGQLAPMFVVLARIMLLPLAPLRLLGPALAAPFLLVSRLAISIHAFTGALFINRAALAGTTIAAYALRAAVMLLWTGTVLMARAFPMMVAGARLIAPAFVAARTAVAAGWAGIMAATQGGALLTLGVQIAFHRTGQALTAASMFIQRQIIVAGLMAQALVQGRWYSVFLSMQSSWHAMSGVLYRGWSNVTLALQAAFQTARSFLSMTGYGQLAALQLVWQGTMTALQAAWHGSSLALTLSYWVTRLTSTQAWHASMLALTTVYNAAETAIQTMWYRVRTALFITQLWGLTGVQRAWHVATLVAETTFQAVRAGIQAMYDKLILALYYGWARLMLLAQRIFGTAWLTNMTKLLASTLMLWRTGLMGVLNMVRSAMVRLIPFLLGPWGIAIAAVVGLLVLFKDQIKRIIDNIKAYFSNIPQGVQNGLAPVTNILVKVRDFVGNIFGSIGNLISRVFNALPDSIKNALLKVVAIIRTAALKIYELFSYINPFARHSPSLVENVTKGMDIVGDKFGATAGVVKGHMLDMYQAMKDFGQAAAGALQNEADYQAGENRTKVQTVAPQALGAYDGLIGSVKTLKGDLAAAEDAIDRQQVAVDRLADSVEAADKNIDAMNETLDILKEAADQASAALDGAKKQYDRFANAQISGMREAEDAIFANEMAQKRLQLQIAKMGETEDIDSATDAYSRLQGQIEDLSGRQSELRAKGAGSDILGPYDQMIASLRAQQDALGNASEGSSSKVDELQNQLDALAKKAEILDLEKSLKFDPLNRQLDQFKNKVDELPFGAIVAGLQFSGAQVDAYTAALDSANQAVSGQELAIKNAQKARDELGASYDLENEKLQTMKDVYDSIEESIRDGEAALGDLVTAADAAIQRAEEAARKAKEKKGGGGDDEYISPGMQNFLDAGQGDFEDTGAGFSVGREGGAFDQSEDMTNYAEDLANQLGMGLGDFDMFAPIKDMWNKTWDWIKNNVGPVYNSVIKMTKDLGAVTAQAWTDTGGTQVMSNAWGKVEDVISNTWNVLVGFWNFIKGLFGPDLAATWKEVSNGVKGMWETIGPQIKALLTDLQPLFDALKLVGVIVVGTLLAVIEIVWEMLNGAIGPIFSFIGDIIGAIIQFVHGVIQVLGGFAQIIIGIFTLDGAKIWEGIKSVLAGVYDLFRSLWDAVYSLFTNAFVLIRNVVWGFVKGIFDFFLWLWDELVGHSIVPDMINGIIDWFLSLPGKVLGMIADFVSAIWNFFWELPGKIFDALGNLHSMLVGVFYDTFGGIISSMPGWVQDVIRFFIEFPGKVIDALGDFAELGKNVIEGFWNGIKNMGSWLKEKVKNFFTDSVPDAIASVLRIGSPSKVTEEQGAWTGEGFANGLDSQQGNVASSAQNLANQITNITLPAVPMNDVLIEFMQSTDDTVTRLGILTDGLAKFRTESSTAEDTMQAVNDTMRETPAVLAGFNESMILANGQINTTTDAGSKMYTQMKEVQTSFDAAGASAFQQALDMGLSADSAVQAAVRQAQGVRDSFVQQAIDAGLPIDAANRLADTYGLIPADILTKLTADTPEAQAAIQKFLDENKNHQIHLKFVADMDNIRNAVNSITAAGGSRDDATAAGARAWAKQDAMRDKDLYIKLHGIDKYNEAMGYAEGGWVQGPGTTTSDSVPAFDPRTGLQKAWLSDEEFVVAAKYAAKYAEILPAINSGTYDPAVSSDAALPAFADGTATAPAATSAVGGLDTLAVDMVSMTAEAQAAWDAYVSYMTTSTTQFGVTQNAIYTGISTAFTATMSKMYADGSALTVAFTTTVTTTLTVFKDGTLALFVTLNAGVIQTLTAMSGQVTQIFSTLGNQLLTVMTDTNNGVTSQFDSMSKNIGTIFNDGIKPVFDAFGPMLQSLEESFTATVDNVGTIWGGINEKVAVPARFVINDVYNDGIRGAWNKFNGFLDLPPLDEHVARFATGGSVFGAGTATSDSIPALLSNGEHVVTAREVVGAGGHRALEMQRKVWASGNPAQYATGGPVGYADGGSIQGGAYMTSEIQRTMWDAVRTAFPNVVLTSGTRTEQVLGRPDNHNGQRALDLGGPMQQIAMWIAQRYPDSLELIHNPEAGFRNIWHGQPHVYDASTMADHADHVHWAMAQMVANDGKLVSMSGAGDPVIDLGQMVTKGIEESMKAVRDRAPMIGGGIGQWIPRSIDVGEKMLKDFLVPKADEMRAKYASMGGGNAEQWRGMAMKAMDRQGFNSGDVAQVNAMLAQIMSESGGDPMAVQKVIDVNTGGNEAAGLLQIAKGTWPGVRDPELPDDRFDPWANMNGALRYYRREYGDDLTTVWGKGHGYDEGGVLEPTPGGYGTYYNHTGKPEMVLTSDDWDAIYAAANNPVDEEMISAGTLDALQTALGTTPLDGVEGAMASAVDGANEAWAATVYDSAQLIGSTASVNKAAAEATKTAGDRIAEVGDTMGKWVGVIGQLAMAVTTAAMSETQDFKTWVPVIEAVGGLIGMIPDQKASYVPWAGYDVELSSEMKKQQLAQQAANAAKGMLQIAKNTAPVILKHVASIGSTIATMAVESGGAWATAIGAIMTGNPIGALVSLPVILKDIFTLIPMVIQAITEIVPALIKAVMNFFTQFSPFAVPGYDTLDAAAKAVIDNEKTIKDNIANPGNFGGGTAQQGGTNETININIYGDVTMPNVTNTSGAQGFVDNLTTMAAG